MIRPLLPLLCGGLAATAAQADPRVATLPFQPAAVVVLHGRPGIESTVAFADDERIENIAVGNSAAWMVTPNKRANLLFVKPAGPRARSNMTVVTDQRTYLFDLVSGVGGAPVYMLRFTYPARPRPAPVAVAAAVPAPPPAMAPAAAPPPEPTALRFAWTQAGDRRLLPERVFDDGRRVFLAWPKDATLPAILARGPAGQEGPVNLTAERDYLVVEGVPAQLLLRAGKQVATLTPVAGVDRGPAAAPAPADSPPPPTSLADARGVGR